MLQRLRQQQCLRAVSIRLLHETSPAAFRRLIEYDTTETGQSDVQIELPINEMCDVRWKEQVE